jgi:hypothetical protein
MWTCPNCGHKFFNKNQSHSCGNFTVDDFLKNKTEHSIDLFHYFIAKYKKVGDFEFHPVKTRIALLTKMRFCSINKIGQDFIDVHFVLTKRYNGNLFFYRIDNLGERFFVHHIRFYKRDEINVEVKKIMKLAYHIGNREHIKSKK